MDNENNIILSNNLSYYMTQKGIDRSKLCEDLGFKYSTVSEWLSAKFTNSYISITLILL